MYVIFLHGRPATGKYTIGKIVADELGIPLFHNHLTVDLVGTLFEFGTDEFVSMREEVWINAFRSAAEAGQSFVFTFNPENTVRQSTVVSLEKAITGNHGEVLFVELECDEEEIEDRLENASREDFGKLRDLELYRKLRETGTFESPVMPSSYLTVNTTSSTPQESASLILDAMADKTK